MGIVPGITEWFVAQNRWPNRVMYHYTSSEALEGILQSKRMWAFDLRAMNDPEELRYAPNLSMNDSSVRCRLILKFSLVLKSDYLNA